MSKKVYEEENIRAIANKIREKTGGNKTYKTTEMPNGIDAVYQAGKSQGGGGGYAEGYEAGQQAEYDRFWDNYQQNGNLTDYTSAFSGKGWTAKTFNPKYKPMLVVGGRSERMFWRFSSKQTEERTSIDENIVDFSQCTSMPNTFQDSTFDTVSIDCSSATSMSNTFNMGNGTSYGIRKIKLKVTDLCTSFTNTFAYNTNLEEVIFTEDSVIAANISFAHSNKLSHESLMSIINALKPLKEVVETVYEYNGVIETRGETATNPLVLNEWYSIQEIRNSNGSPYHLIILKDSSIGILKNSSNEPFNENAKEIILYEKNSNGAYRYGLKVLEEKPATETKTLTFGTTNLAKLTDEEKAIAADKGWILA